MGGGGRDGIELVKFWGRGRGRPWCKGTQQPPMTRCCNKVPLPQQGGAFCSEQPPATWTAGDFRSLGRDKEGRRKPAIR
jgi:hypothetical protein